MPHLGRIAGNNSSKDAIGVREAFTSLFSVEGTVPWQDTVDIEEESMILSLKQTESTPLRPSDFFIAGGEAPFPRLKEELEELAGVGGRDFGLCSVFKVLFRKPCAPLGRRLLYL
ncbi:hypothetical protein EYF80_027420 [Liparis tanakae]|uniref:Uncharacterized protein n=1 Tax=Liparis tanakae TaxID=230148 RepID=A0A4Z2H9B1_9TELE|nr:hypothetical protein EYF80_027420 [Liparis tanakae]